MRNGKLSLFLAWFTRKDKIISCSSFLLCNSSKLKRRNDIFVIHLSRKPTRICSILGFGNLMSKQWLTRERIFWFCLSLQMQIIGMRLFLIMLISSEIWTRRYFFKENPCYAHSSPIFVSRHSIHLVHNQHVMHFQISWNFYTSFFKQSIFF